MLTNRKQLLTKKETQCFKAQDKVKKRPVATLFSMQTKSLEEHHHPLLQADDFL